MAKLIAKKTTGERKNLFKNIFILVLLIIIIFQSLVILLNKHNLDRKESLNDYQEIRTILNTEKQLFNRYFDRKFDLAINGPLFQDPFQAMTETQQELNKSFSNSWENAILDSHFNSWAGERFGGLKLNYEVAETESPTEKTITIKFNRAIDAEKINVSVKSGIITMENRTQNKQKNSESYFYFLRQFPVPAGVHAAAFKISRAGKNIVISFPKK